MTKIAMCVALIVCGAFAAGCDEREWGLDRHHGDRSSTDVSVGLGWLPWFGGYETDEYYEVTDYYTTEVVDYGGYGYDYGYDYYYEDGIWKTKR
jgi:hypothetical protein